MLEQKSAIEINNIGFSIAFDDKTIELELRPFTTNDFEYEKQLRKCTNDINRYWTMMFAYLLTTESVKVLKPFKIKTFWNWILRQNTTVQILNRIIPISAIDSIADTVLRTQGRTLEEVNKLPDEVKKKRESVS